MCMRVNRTKLISWSVAAFFFSVALGQSNASAAEIVVQPDSLYFEDWVFSSISPNGVPERVDLVAGQVVNGTLNGRDFTWSVDASPAPDTFGLWTDGYNTFGLNLPLNIARPIPSPGQFFLNRGVSNVLSTTPLPAGTTFFFQDVDNDETAYYRFYDCAGNPLDAGDFDFLNISTINKPLYSIEGAPPARYWRVASPVGAGNDPNSVNGIVIRSSQVCQINIEAVRPGNGGSINYFLGAPRAAFAAQDQANATPVPFNAWWMLFASSLGIALSARKWTRKRSFALGNPDPA